MSGQVFEGKTVEEALQKAASELGVEVAGLEHEPAGEKSSDFWGLGEPTACVRAWVRRDEEAVSAPPPEPQEEPGARAAEVPQEVQPPLDPPAIEEDGDSGTEADNRTETSSFFAPAPAPEPPIGRVEAGEASAAAGAPAGGGEERAPDNLEEATVALLDRIFGAMGFDCSAEARVDGDGLLVAISGDDNQYLLDGRGRGLSALELILNHAFRHRAGAENKKIHVDAGDFRARREDEIRDLAYQVSHQAKETGTEQETQPLNPYERRIVHLTLADDAEVTTRSRGSGFMKPVSIIPSPRGRQ